MPINDEQGTLSNKIKQREFDKFKVVDDQVSVSFVSPDGSKPASASKQDNLIVGQIASNVYFQNITNQINTLINGVLVSLKDGAQIDAFSRLRVSAPQTLFDNKQIFDDSALANNIENSPLFYDNQQTSGGGTSTTFNPNKASTTLSVSANTAGARVRQTKMRFNYQPGKSILALMSFVFGSQASGITQREGLFDEKNGLYFEDNGTNYGFVTRTYVTGSAVNNRIVQADWNLDTLDGNGASGFNLDFTKTQILVMDYEWLGVGRVRMGFVVDGLIIYAHEFNNTNNLSVVYMSTPNLPLRSEIINDGTGVAKSMDQICSTVISEGGSDDLGVIRYASTGGTHLDANTENTLYALLGIKLKSAYIGASIKLLNTAIQLQTASHRLEWVLLLNPTVADTFTYSDISLSALQVAKGATANTVTGGYELAGGFVESGSVASGGAGSLDRGINNAVRLGSLIDGTVDSIVLAVRPIGGTTNADVEGSITWRELS